MGVVGSLPSPPPAPPSPVYTKIEISHEDPILSREDCSYCNAMSDEMDSTTNSSFNSNINDDNISKNYKSFTPENSMSVPTYQSPSKRRQSAPTLETGRRSKFLQLDGIEAVRREARRTRNREAARKLKIKRSQVEEQLKKEIDDLESKEQALLLSIKNLDSYKTELETQYRKIVSIQERLALTASSTLKHIQHNRLRIHESLPSHQNNSDVKHEPRSPSPPQWQLFFSI
jgi:hypothetical protein